jgi:hypothetical protein
MTTDRRALAENLRIRIRELEAETAELSEELRRILTPHLTPVPGPDEEPNDE